jgi:lipopolysaccharide/colanic/teichoic acid biosynthesis glycosyltransferase
MSIIGILILSPFFIIFSFLILFSGKGAIIFRQVRVGRYGKEFSLYKFRTMRPHSEKTGQLTIGSRDPRITRIGYFLRKTKMDELPQLFNVLLGHMSFVGPRPEVRKYVSLYNKEQLRVLEVRPGITDQASIEYFEESDLLAKSANPEETYIKDIMPKKLAINLKYLENKGLFSDVSIIMRTLGRVFGLGKKPMA